MTMKPYIFLSQNFLNFSRNENLEDIMVREISNQQVPYSQVFFFTDRYGNIINRTIDTLVLRDTNIVNLLIEAADGLGNYTTVFSLLNNEEKTVIVKLSTPVITSSLRIVINNDTYNPTSVSAKIGIYRFLCNLFALTDSNYKIEANQGGYRVVSGAYIHWADYKKWVGKVKMENLPQEQFNALTEQADLGEITAVPYQDLEAEAIYECVVKREYSWELDRKTGLFKLDLELNEL